MIRKVRLLAWVPALSAVLIMLVMYSSWAVAYRQLGRPPRPSIDDPKSIGGFSTDLYAFCLPFVFALFVIWLVSWAITVLVADSPKTERGSVWGLGAAVGAIAFGLLVALFVVSPGEAIAWFFD